MEDSKATEAIVVANQVFNDQVSVDAFLAPLPEELFRFYADMKVQLFDLQDEYSAVSDGLRTKVDATKAYFNMVGAAIMSLAFETTHPEVVIRRSGKPSESGSMGLMFIATFLILGVFQSTLTTGTFTKLKKELTTNWDWRHRELDLQFPSN